PPEVVALVDAAIDATAIVDEELRVIRCNRSYLMLAGVRAHEMRRTGLRAVCHERLTLQTCSEGLCVARRAFELKRPVRVDEVRSARNDLRVVVMAVPLLGRDGIPYAAVESYRDVTAESRMQDNYKQLLVRERGRNVVLQEEVN